MTDVEVTRSVFVPGLMGAGILLSAGLLLADGIRRIAPNRGTRRKVAVARAVRAYVEGAARAAGRRVSARDLVRREARPRAAYLALGATLGALGGLVARAGTDAFFGPGTLHGNPWALGIGLGFGALGLGGIAFLAFALSALGGRGPLRPIVGGTWAGRLAAPPDDIHARVHLLVPESEEGEER